MPDFFNMFVRAIGHLAALADAYEQFCGLQEQMYTGYDDVSIETVNQICGNVHERMAMLQRELGAIDKRCSEVAREHLSMQKMVTEVTEGTDPQ